MQNLFFLTLISFIVWVIAAGNTSTQPPPPTTAPIQTSSVFSPAPSTASLFPTPRANNFSCDGRQYCSQMSSRAEAVFFIKNCPNTKMDGDNDGDPCESDSRF